MQDHNHLIYFCILTAREPDLHVLSPTIFQLKNGDKWNVLKIREDVLAVKKGRREMDELEIVMKKMIIIVMM